MVEQVRASPGFTRLQIADGADTTELDLAWDARIRNLRDSEYGPVLDRDELAAEKDRGFVADAFAGMLKSIGRRDRNEFQCDDARH